MCIYIIYIYNIYIYNIYNIYNRIEYITNGCAHCTMARRILAGNLLRKVGKENLRFNQIFIFSFTKIKQDSGVW